MLIKLFKLLRKVVIAGFALYAYNFMAVSLGLIIPINIWTLSLVTIFGITAIPFLALLLIFAF